MRGQLSANKVNKDLVYIDSSVQQHYMPSLFDDGIYNKSEYSGLSFVSLGKSDTLKWIEDFFTLINPGMPKMTISA